MTIGIDISQIVYEGTGVATYVRRLVFAIIKKFPGHSYILFGSSLRKRHVFIDYLASLKRETSNVRLITLPIPPTMLDVLWNRLHIVPIEWFTGRLDVFWSSDWTQPPLSRARGVTTIHDLSILHYPEESHDKTEIRVFPGEISANIVNIQKRRLSFAAKECSIFFCDSKATKKDAEELLGIEPTKVMVVYPGY